MTAAVDTMFSTAVTPWHRQGIVLDSPPTIEAAIEAAGLTWQVCQLPVGAIGKRETRVVNGYYANVRSDTGAILGLVKSRYRVLQNNEAFKFFEPFIEAGAILETAGALHGGKTVWVLARIPHVSEIKRGDRIAHYLLLSNNHAGERQIECGETDVRVVCANTLASAHRTMKATKVRHTHTMRARLADAQQALEVAIATAKQRAEHYRALAARPLIETMLDEYVTRVFGLRPKAQPKLDVDRVMDKTIEIEAVLGRRKTSSIFTRVKDAYRNAPGADRGSWWGAYNAVTHYCTHTRGRSPDNRLVSNTWGPGSRTLSKALDLALEMSKS